jgi:hypothetical protein
MSISSAGRAPDFFCIGAQKSGTTWLYQNLAAHPGVWLPPIKELHYFNQVHIKGHLRWTQRHRTDRVQKQLRQLSRGPQARENEDLVKLLELIASSDVGDAWYSSIFARAPEGAVCGDFTPEYSILPDEGVRHVHDLAPQARVILLVRDPIDRAWSQVRMHLKRRPESDPLTLAQSKDIVRRSDYEAILSRWRARFGASRLFVRSLDDIESDPAGVVTETCRFLGLPFDTAQFERLHDHIHRGVDADMPDDVRAFFLGEMEELYDRLASVLPEEGARWRARHYGSQTRRRAAAGEGSELRRASDGNASRSAPLVQRKPIVRSEGSQRLTVLLCHEHSGSDLLGEFVRSLDGVYLIDDVGHRTSATSIHRFRRKAIADDPDLLVDPSLERHGRFVASYFDALLESRAPANVVVEIKYRHVNLFESLRWSVFERPYLLRHFQRSGAHVLHLYRRNVVEAAASALIEGNQGDADQDGGGSAATNGTDRIHISVDKLIRRATVLARQTEWFEEKAIGNATRLTVTCEGLVEELGTGGDLDQKIANFVGGESNGTFSRRGQRPRPLAEVAENYDALRRACATAKLGQFFDHPPAREAAPALPRAGRSGASRLAARLARTPASAESDQSAVFDFVIFAMARTGSTLLCSRLKSAGAACHFELYHPQRIQSRGLAHAWSAEERDRNPAGFMAAVKSATPDMVTGCKVFAGHLRDPSFLLDDGRIKKVILYRENVLAAFASGRQASAMGKWVNVADRTPPKVVFDPVQFARYRERATAWYTTLLDRLNATDQAFFLYPYALINSPSHFKSLLRFLELELSEPAELKRHRKVGSNDILSRFENPDEVRACLVENGLQAWEYEIVAGTW